MDELIAKLERAEAGSKELDADVFLALSPDAFGADILRRERDTGNLMWKTGGASFQYPQGGGVSFPIPAVTSSLEAAIRCVEKNLPGYEWFVNSGGLAGVRSDAYDNGANGNHENSPALALCIALLKALRAADKQGGGG